LLIDYLCLFSIKWLSATELGILYKTHSKKYTKCTLSSNSSTYKNIGSDNGHEERVHLHPQELETNMEIRLQRKKPNLSLSGSVCVSAGGICGREDVGLRVQLCILKGEASANSQFLKWKNQRRPVL
jgi:hypothetical protein